MRYLTVLLLLCCLGLETVLLPTMVHAKTVALPSSVVQHVSKANQLANQGRYNEALAIYKQIKAQATEKGYWNDTLVTSLARPMASLSYNLAAEAQKQGDVAKALHWCEEGLAVKPADKGLKELKAYLLYNQALEQVELYENYPKGLALLQQAEALNPVEKSLNKARAGFYLRWAKSSLQEGHSQAAWEQAQAALKADPDEPSVQRSVANVALSLAAKEANKSQQEAYLKAAVQASRNNPEVATQVEQWRQRQTLSGRVKETARQAVGLGPDASSAPKHPFLLGEAAGQSLSALEQLSVLEEQLLGTSPLSSERPLALPSEKLLPERLAILEKTYYGQVQTGLLPKRLDALYSEVITSGVATVQADYLQQVLALTQGHVLRFQNFPVRVYIQKPPVLKDNKTLSAEQAALWKHYTPAYEESIKAALQSWRSSTLGFINTVLVPNEDQADVAFLWAATWKDPYSSQQKEKTLAFYKELKPIKPSKTAKALKVASAFAPGPYGLLPQAGAAALDYATLARIKELRQKNNITLGLQELTLLSKAQAENRLHNLVVLEFGRRLGLLGNKATDALFTSVNTSKQAPSAADLATLKALYLRKPDLPLN